MSLALGSTLSEGVDLQNNHTFYLLLVELIGLYVLLEARNVRFMNYPP